MIKYNITQMKLNKNSNLKDIFKQNKNALNSIKNINGVLGKIPDSTFEKYANSGVNLSQLSLLGDTNTNDILIELEKIGFEVELDKKLTKKVEKEDKIEFDKSKLKVLDVRPTIASGEDPFKDIMQAIKVLKDDETLQIINVFVPIPLINVLEGKGFKSWSDTISDNEYHTFFTKGKTSLKNEDFNTEEDKNISFEDKLKNFGENVKQIDVRHMEMPEPMVTILEEIENLPENFVLLVKHKKVPQFLLPELKTRNFKWMHKENSEENFVWFMVFK